MSTKATLITLISVVSVVSFVVVIGVVFMPRLVLGSAERGETTVRADGFELNIGEIVITGEPGVAPSGTKVEAETHVAVPVSGVFEAGESASSGVAIELGDSLQPKAEIIIEMPVAQKSANGLSPAFAVQEHDGRMMTADFDLDESTGTGVISTRQLSTFGFIQIGMDKLVESLTESLKQFFDLSVKKPECHREELKLFGSEFTLKASEADAAWLCFDSAENNRIDLSLTLNTPGAWLITSDAPLVERAPTTVDIADMVIFSLFRNHPGVDAGSALVLPTVSANSSFADAPNTIDLSMSPGYTTMWSVLSLAASIIPLSNLAGLEKAQCLANVVNSIDDSPRLVKSVIGCVAEFTKGAGFIFGLIAAAPASLAANISGIIREATGKTFLTYSLTPHEDLAPPTENASGPAAESTRLHTFTPFESDGRIRQSVTIEDLTDLPPLPAGAEPSLSGVAPRTYWLGSNADSASACWQHPDHDTEVICLRNPWSDETFARSVDATLPESVANNDPMLWAIELDDGSRWQVRIGGSWGGRPDGWYGTYRCIEQCARDAENDLVILSNDEFPHGYDDSSNLWVAFVGEISSDGRDFPPPKKIAITEGWFVG